MNNTICGKTGKTIRKWERQCFPCIHCRLVFLKEEIEGIIHYHYGLFLFDCPHVKKISRKSVKIAIVTSQ